MKKYNKYFILIIIIFFIWSYYMEHRNASKWLIKSITDGYEGIVVDTFSTNRTFVFKVKSSNSNDTLVISSSTLTDEFYKNIYPSIKIFKPKSENYVYLLDTFGIERKVFYEKISWKDRKSSTFPKNWKDKWLKASEWDKQ